MGVAKLYNVLGVFIIIVRASVYRYVHKIDNFFRTFCSDYTDLLHTLLF